MSKLFVVDDELPIRNLCRDLFAKSGHDVISLALGQDALDLLEKEKPDLILMDIQIPGENGLSLLEKIRARAPRMPVAVFSGYVTAELEKEAYEAGAVEVIRKGSSAVELRDKINKVLAAKHRIFSDKSDKKIGKVLIVDDEERIRTMLAEFLTRKGLEIIQAKNGEEAIRLVQSENPAVVLLDVMMPGMDGISTLKKIREINPDLGVVMATATQDEQLAHEATELGAYHYVLKPFDLQYLELVVLTRLFIAA